jgi:hypothetical protein
MPDYKSEIPLDPQTPRITIHYLSKNETLIQIGWAVGADNFSVAIGDEYDPDYYMAAADDNPYVVAAQMVGWLDEWCERNNE